MQVYLNHKCREVPDTYENISLSQDKTSNSNLKIEALVFTRLVMASHSSAVFHPHIRVYSQDYLILFWQSFSHISLLVVMLSSPFSQLLKQATKWVEHVSLISCYMHLKMWSMQALSGPVLAAVGERYYKVTAEALRVCGELVKAIRPNFDMVRDYFLMYGHVMHCFMVDHLCNCFS